jgi:hypothetical protein
MKNIFKLLCLVLPLVVATSCQETPEPLPEPVVAISSEYVIDGTSAIVSLTVANADKALYVVKDTKEIASPEEYTPERVLSEGVAVNFSTKESYSSPQSAKITLENLTKGHEYYLFVAAANADLSVVEQMSLSVEFAKDEMPMVGNIEVITLEPTTATFGTTLRNVDKVRYAVVPKDVYDANCDGNGIYMGTDEYGYTVVEVERSLASVPFSFEATDLTPSTNYVVIVIADNADVEMEPVDAAASAEFATPSAGPMVEMTDISIDDMVGHSVEFSVTTRYMDNFGFVVVPTAEYEELSVEYVLANSFDYYWDEGNLSWDQDFTFPFHADTEDETDYTVVAVAVNEHSSVMKVATFTTPKEEMTVEMLSISPTSASLTSSGSDHYLTMRTALYELCVHLVSDSFGGRYEPTSSTHNFVAEGSYFKELNLDDTWTVYDDLDTTLGNIDLYENVITGKWEIYGSFFFKPVLTLQIEIPSGIAISGAERAEPVEFNFNVTKAEAVQDATKKAVWHLTLEQDDDNTITFDIKLDSSKYEFIPSGEYLYDGQGAPCLDGCSRMIVNNVSTSLANKRIGVSKVVVEYNEATGETYASAEVYVASGTAVVNIDKCGPFKLYEEVVQGLEVVSESRNLMIWATWQSSLKSWELNFSGDTFYGYLYFTTGANNSAYLPEGRYVFSKSAPAGGGLWLDCSRSYVAKLRTSDQRMIDVNAENAYFDVTTRVDQFGNYIHTISGVIHTEDGFYRINFDYGEDRGTIY